MKKKLKLILATVTIYSNFFNAHPENFSDYPLSFIVDTCKITQKRTSPERLPENEVLSGRAQYKTCLNFIISLSTTLNRRCMAVKKEEIKPSESMTYADLSNVNSTNELIKEIMEYSYKYPHFGNQLGWLHASKALSQKWPCKKL